MKRKWNNLPRCGDSSLRNQRLIRLGARVLLVAGVLSGVGIMAVAGDHVTSTKSPTTKSHHWLQFGEASWYGGKFQGKKTATGERFDMNSLTCAHPSLPLGSWIRVTNLHTRKSIFVRVNDRGPVVDHRIIDLSYAAARAVGLTGIGRVKLEAVNANDPEMAKALVAQLAIPQFPLESIAR